MGGKRVQVVWNGRRTWEYISERCWEWKEGEEGGVGKKRWNQFWERKRKENGVWCEGFRKRKAKGKEKGWRERK